MLGVRKENTGAFSFEKNPQYDKEIERLKRVNLMKYLKSLQLRLWLY